jgi:deoxyribodipyrimidine photo-lyase
VGRYHGSPEAIFKKLIADWPIEKVVCNTDYEPYARSRDQKIGELLKSHGIGFEQYKDQVLFEKSEVIKDDGSPYKVFTPYSRKWKSLLGTQPLIHYPSEAHLEQLSKVSLPKLTLREIGFTKSTLKQPQVILNNEVIDRYEATRNFPALDKTSRVGTALRFGTVSVRKLIKSAACRPNLTFLNELIWREFFMQIIWHFPHTTEKSFKPQYDRIEWRNNPDEFQAWCQGNTGYPLVDAGMRQLNATGFMHNRIRMVAGSFLCKHLLIDWRWGEAYFAAKLFDFELSSNVGNWQWVAGCGVDAAPYFRIFNPSEQIKKFDKNHDYIQQWVPEYQEMSYPKPIVEHKFARKRCLEVYKEAVVTP